MTVLYHQLRKPTGSFILFCYFYLQSTITVVGLVYPLLPLAHLHIHEAGLGHFQRQDFYLNAKIDLERRHPSSSIYREKEFEL